MGAPRPGREPNVRLTIGERAQHSGVRLIGARSRQAHGLGARHVDIGQRPEEGHIVLTDPEGNEFCVIEPGNKYLAGCGFMAEITCAGSRETGFFWSEALEWPLVWDQGLQTAIQSPRLSRIPKSRRGSLIWAARRLRLRQPSSARSSPAKPRNGPK